MGTENSTTYNRSGYFTSNSTGKRISLTVSDYTSNYINVCKTHYGHECILGYTRLQSTLRQSIASKLTQGVEVDRIIIR